MEESLDAWFKREILVHERMLMRFLGRVWPRRDEHADLCQESFARVYEAAVKSRPTAPKAFLFMVARNLMSDRVRRDRIVSIQAAGENEFLNVLIDEISPEQRVGANQELARLAQAFDRLPPRCREVVWLRRVRELSQKQVAARLGLSERTVEKYVAEGGRLLAQYMHRESLPTRAARTAHEQETDDEQENGHGTRKRD